jgi:hypothetical protein
MFDTEVHARSHQEKGKSIVHALEQAPSCSSENSIGLVRTFEGLCRLASQDCQQHIERDFAGTRCASFEY